VLNTFFNGFWFFLYFRR